MGKVHAFFSNYLNMAKITKKSKKIWIIDDDPGILEVIDIILKEEGYSTKAICNGSTVFEELRKETPRLILLDVLMSGIDGREISRDLKKDKRTRDIPVIIMTADMQIEEKAKEAQADGYLQKPFNIDEILTVLTSHLRR